MKNTLSFALFILPFLCFAQSDDYKQINKYLALKKTKKGYVFTDNKGKQSEEYDYVYLNSNGFIETTKLMPIYIDENERPQSIPFDTMRIGECGTPTNDNSIRREYHVFELMKKLKIIDDFGFKPFTDFTWADIRDGKIDDLGYASKDGKYALVTNKGEFLTDFKYNHSIYFEDKKPTFNNYTENGKLVTVVLDYLTGIELLKIKDSIVQYWNAENYLVKNNKGKYFLTYRAKKYEVPEIWIYVRNLSFESSLFTYKKLYSKNRLTVEERGFITLDGKKVVPENEITPYTNFHKGHCIAVETIKEEQKYDTNDRAFPQKETRVLKIINENFETVKVLDEVSYIDSYFNKYGQIIVESKSTSDNEFVIDYNGNHIIPPSKFENRIREIYAGIYKIEDRAYPATNESQQQENFYNQKGEKLANEETQRITRNIKFKEGITENHLVSNGFKMVTLDKENNVIDSYYK